MRNSVGVVGSAHIDLLEVLSVFGIGDNQQGELTGAPTGMNDYYTSFHGMTGLPHGVVAVACFGGEHLSVVIGSDGKVYGTGANWVGQLTGTGSNTKSTLTVMTGLPEGVTAISGATAGSTIIIGSDGIPYATGYNAYHQITGSGNKSALTPMTGLPGGVSAVKASVGGAHTVVIGSDGIPYAAGYNGSGQITGPINHSASTATSTLTPMTGLPGGVSAIDCDAYNNSSLIVGSNGVAYGTGYNSYGQLTGTGTGDKITLTGMTGLPGGVSAVKCALGQFHSVIIGSDGNCYGSGYNASGQITGTGNKSTLTLMTGLPVGVSAVGCTCGDIFTIVYGSDGILYGTGYNGWNLLSGTESGDKLTLTPFTSDFDIIGYGAGYSHVLVIRS